MRLRFDPAAYPGPRPAGPVLVHAGAVHDVVADGTADTPVRAAVDAPVLAPGSVAFSVAYGANASPERLIDKGLDRHGALLLPARLAGWVPVFEARRTGYGAVPLTLVPDRGSVLDTWVLGVHLDDVAVLDRSEGRMPSDAPTQPPTNHTDDPVRAPPGTYVLGRIGEVAVADRFRLPDALAFLPGPRAMLQQLPGGGWRTWPEHDQAAAGAHVDDEGLAVPALAADDPVLGPWPSTPLADLPLFVYGTLRPGEAAWDLVADLVEPVGDATVPGTLHDSGHGWPAAVFDDDPAGQRGEVHGVLLTPRSTDVAPELLARVDRYEGAPTLFRRVVVRAATSAGQRWALAYGWAGAQPPGSPVTHGRW